MRYGECLWEGGNLEGGFCCVVLCLDLWMGILVWCCYVVRWIFLSFDF